MGKIQSTTDLDALYHIKSKIIKIGIKNMDQDLFKLAKREVEIQFEKFIMATDLEEKIRLIDQAVKPFKLYSAFKEDTDFDYE